MFESARWLVSLPKVVGNDYRLLATFEYEEIAREYDQSSKTMNSMSNPKTTHIADDLSTQHCSCPDSIQDETSRTGILSDDWENQVNTRVAAIDDWFARWEPVASEPSYGWFARKTLTHSGEA